MKSVLKKFDILNEHSGAGTGSWMDCGGEIISSISPIDGQEIAKIRCADINDYEKVVSRAVEAFKTWRMIPAPKRGKIVRRIGDALRVHKKDIGELVTIEMGKIRSEGEGEVQEMIDIADFAVGQARMLYGLSMHSERRAHRMYEQWHPLGPVGVITSFNFPVAPWAWNAMIALVAGNTIIWKPSSKVPLSAIAVMNIVWNVLNKEKLPEGICNIVIGNREAVADALVRDRRVALISATGSVAMGRNVGQTVAARLGKTILELGGNNAVIITHRANIEMAVRAIVFGALGTAGQRCTSTRRVIVHESIYDRFVADLKSAYRKIRIGNPLDEGVLMGPLIDHRAVEEMQSALMLVREQGGRVLYGGDVLTGGIYDAGGYVAPAICEVKQDLPIVQHETFAPILYLIKYRRLVHAIADNNAVPQGLSSSIFTNDLQEAECFLSHWGSDCGIANVNIGTSGAEIGGAFGGEKDTGGGREAGSDAWKSYMRRQTCTINWSGELPLAQGIAFGIGDSEAGNGGQK